MAARVSWISFFIKGSLIFFLCPLLGLEKIGFISDFSLDTWGQTKKNELLAKILDGGYILEEFSSNIADYCNVVVFNNPFEKELQIIQNFPKEKITLFMWEPPTVIPHLYDKKLHQYFSKIFTWADDLVDNRTYFKVFYPVLQPMRTDIPKFQEKKFCALFSRNLTSSISGELYSERRRAIAFFERLPKGVFDFYGRDWEPLQSRNYKGYVEDKIEVLKQYKFNICYENTSNVKGYVTEKIFDAFAAGVVPVYLGAPNIEDYIPKECFIDRRNFPDYPSLYAFLRNITEEQYESYLDHIREFLHSEKAQLFSLEHFVDIFCNQVP